MQFRNLLRRSRNQRRSKLEQDLADLKNQENALPAQWQAEKKRVGNTTSTKWPLGWLDDLPEIAQTLERK